MRRPLPENRDMLFQQDVGLTYVPSPYAERNVFISREPENEPLPEFADSWDRLPHPFWEGHPDELAMYKRAWEIAFGNLRRPQPGSPFVSNFIDTAFNGFLFMWDSAFITMFGRYGSAVFDFQKTLDNFYSSQHKDGFICRELREDKPGEHFSRYDPSATGPEVLPWSEWEHYLTTGDIRRLSEVFDPLMAYRLWRMQHHTWPDGTYFSSGWGCGMDNQPRQEPCYDQSYSTGHMSWIDACFQAILSDRILTRMAAVLGREGETALLREEAERLTAFVNERMWSEEDGFYYDRWRDGRLNGIKTIGAYWGLLADAVPEDRLEPFVDHLRRTEEFNRPHRIPTMPADSPFYIPAGGYWRGAVWAPTNYMVLRGLERNGYTDLAHEIAVNHLEAVTECFRRTGTLWENYGQEDAGEPGIHDGHPGAREFVGWTGLVPICVMPEYVFGISGVAREDRILWKVRLTEAHGMANYPLGSGLCDLRCEARRPGEKPTVTIRAPFPVTADVIWEGGAMTVTNG